MSEEWEGPPLKLVSVNQLERCRLENERLREALEATERALHDWLAGRSWRCREMVVRELSAVRVALYEIQE